MHGKLSAFEIEALASKPDVRRIAVENFLSGVPGGLRQWENEANMRADAASYRWKPVTVRAIQAGIKLAYSGKPVNNTPVPSHADKMLAAALAGTGIMSLSAVLDHKNRA